MDRFSKLHPFVSFSFFMLVIIVSLININPVFISVSFICAFLYLLRLQGREAVLSLFKYILPLVIVIGIFNMLFCRYGSTVLFTVQSSAFTLEALCYGLCTGLMLACVIMWFSAYSIVITSEKFMALFGGIAPNLALLFSMVLRFIPLMKKTSREITEAQIGMGNEIKGIKNTLKRFSALVSISLEKSIETADSMKARGFGNKKRGYYSRYSFSPLDFVLLILLAAMFLFMLASKYFGYFEFQYENEIRIVNFNAVALIVLILFCALPVIIDLKEDIKWLFLKSKI